MSVLAHVVLKGALPGEPAATQALAHILNASPDIARALLGTLRQADIEFDPGISRPSLDMKIAVRT